MNINIKELVEISVYNSVWNLIVSDPTNPNRMRQSRSYWDLVDLIWDSTSNSVNRTTLFNGLEKYEY